MEAAALANNSDIDDAIRVGDPAPDFRLPAVNRDGDIGLGDYRGRRALLLGLFRGLHCPFCRRQVVQMTGYSERLAALGVDGLAVVNTELDRARLYYGRLQLALALAVDPHWQTHRRYGLSRPKITFGKTEWPRKVNPMDMLTLRLNPTGELPQPVSAFKANAAVNRIDGFKPTLLDRKIQVLHGSTGAGYTLIEKDGIVRWRWLEGETGLADIGRFPSADDVLAAVSRALS
jgi:peroxiredoxin